MTEQLRGARLKLARAEEHFTELATDHQRFLDRNPYRALRETDGRPHHFVWRIKVVEEPPFDKWAALVGDCVHALRSALDHTAYELVRINKPLFERSEFPIFENRLSWDRDHGKKLPGVAPEVLAVAESVQPYNGTLEDAPLWRIHELDIIDKHRRLALVGSTLAGTRWGIEGATVENEPILGSFVDGAVVGRFRIDSEEGANVNMYQHFAFGIAFGDGGPAAGEPVMHALEWMRVYAAGVISQFEVFFT